MIIVWLNLIYLMSWGTINLVPLFYKKGCNRSHIPFAKIGLNI